MGGPWIELERSLLVERLLEELERSLLKEQHLASQMERSLEERSWQAGQTDKPQ